MPKTTKLDILVLAAHPDDAELGCGGTIAKHIALGHRVGIVDITRGELGTRGTPQLREKEALDSARILGVSTRESLNLPDGFFQNTKEHQISVIRAIRKYRPQIVLANAVYDRHSDHGRAAELVTDASFLSGLVKVETQEDGVPQEAWRPSVIYHYIQSQLIAPDIIVDVSDHWAKKMEAIAAFKTQFYDPANTEPETYISNPGFLKLVESRGIEFGHAIGVKYGEGYTVRRFIGIRSLFDIF
jgi:bacillithiol biosynthesis deacetylase BshB1